jgi:antitoxin YefM
MKTINFSDARSNLKQVLDRVVDDADVTIITRRDAEDVVVMPLSTWNSWKETEYLLASPANARHLREAIARLDEGKFVRGELVEPMPPNRINEPRAKYEISGKSKRPKAATKRTKRG